jgi:DNA-binding transcriptional ArsR family regulator
MLDRSSARLDLVFRALAHPARRAILKRLASDERSIVELAKPFDMSLEAVSQHVQVLERAGLLRRTRTGREYRCRLTPKPLGGVTALVAQVTRTWERQLDSLDRYLRDAKVED